MSSGAWPRVLQSAIDKMGTSTESTGPLPLIDAIVGVFRDRQIAGGEDDAERLAAALLPDDPNELLGLKWGETLRAWDYIEEADWTSGTARLTRERRDVVYSRLQMPLEWCERCEAKYPIATFAVVPVIGAADWTRWYLPARREQRRFYWSRYGRYLREKRGWSSEAVENLDQDSTAVLERLADPESQAAVSVRGLVVGYVQSGKTANFTAVIAKAVDAGYRLVIVLAGTLNVLRNQTQRRLDKELLGKETIELRPNDDGRCDYCDDREWEQFVSYGALPGRLGGCDWQRLTTARFDYRSLKAGIAALEFRQRLPGRPYNDPQNLHADVARLLVIKKAPAILKKVINDLRRLGVVWETVPALIIDDESDLASVNTLPQRAVAEEAEKRTRTNAAIVNLLTLLKRSAYVGYTATPAATVLMNDQDELFPRDFIIPLPKPPGYMGVAEFIDGDGVPDVERYRERCYVRHVEGDDPHEANLPRAIDAFVLAGCIKIHRERSGEHPRYRHHTMLVHRSHQVSEHERDRLLVAGLLDPTRYLSADGVARLARLLRDDFVVVRDALVSAGRVGNVGTFPGDDALPELVSAVFERLHQEPVLVANGDPRNEERAPDFDETDVWGILVGGTKLSRGYTVEGLTISYYRRRVAAADTLMQMGRWFGYRQGYADLVRVFLGREVRRGLPVMDLHEEFRACCLDEERFRDQLARYALQSATPLRPLDVPPLVLSSGGLSPTSPNKMRCARRAYENFGAQHSERTLAPTRPEDIEWNWTQFGRLCGTSRITAAELVLRDDVGLQEMRACGCVVTSNAMREFLSAYRWSRDGAYQDVLDFLAGGQGDPAIDTWAVLAPNLRGRANESRAFCGFRVDVHKRSRTGVDRLRYKVYSDPPHVRVAKWIAGVSTEGQPNDLLSGLRAPRRGAMVAYACRDDAEEVVNLGFFLVFPGNRLPWRVAFVTNSTRS